jgi:signal transduction histidine kinase
MTAVSDAQHPAATLELEARAATLTQLLEVYERSVIEQSQKLYAEQERMRFQAALLECQGEASPDGILSVGRAGRILVTNRRLAEVWGLAQECVETRSYESLRPLLARQTSDPAAFLGRTAALRSDEASREEVVLADGRTLDQYTAPIRGADGRDFGRVWYFRDISAVKEVARLKDEFISAVSHELRTPLTSIVGSLGLMEAGAMGDLPTEAARMVSTAKRNCDRLVRLINDVLDVEKIEAGRIALRLELLELEPLLNEALAAIRPYGDPLGVRFQLVGAVPEVRLRVDPDRLLQVLENLLSNAAKYSPEGETVRVSAQRRGRFIRVSVCDRGPGIAPELEDRLFDKFVQGMDRGARNTSGTGLGLNISRAIVERLGGRIGFRREAVGTTFYFDLPERDLPERDPPERDIAAADQPDGGSAIEAVPSAGGRP